MGSSVGIAEAEEARGARFVFVGGAPRSGTTLVQNMLDSHAAIVGGPEFLHLPEIARLRGSLEESIRKGWITDFCDLETMEQALAELIENLLLLPLADRYDAALISEKTPQNVLVFDELLRLFPKAHFIHVVRDPRAVVASMLKVGQRAKAHGTTLQPFTRDIRAAVRHVKECYRAGCAVSAAAPDQVLTVSYERLVRDPVGQTRAMCRFLGLDWDEAMVRPGERPHIGLGPITEGSGNLWYDRDSYQRNPEDDHIEAWRTALTPLQKAVVVVSLRDFEPVRRCGYRLTAESLSGAEHAIGRTLLGLRELKRLLPSLLPALGIH